MADHYVVVRSLSSKYFTNFVWDILLDILPIIQTAVLFPVVEVILTMLDWSLGLEWGFLYV